MTHLKGIVWLLLWTVIVHSMASIARGDDGKPASLRSGLTRWGNLTVTQDAVTITGHDAWTASGTIQKNGEVHLVWTMKSEGGESYALGIYRFDGERLGGKWGWFKDVSRTASGELSGVDVTEVIEVIQETLSPLR